MINRSALKYHLKKILPKSIFAVIYLIWQKILIRIIETIDRFRLKNFTSAKTVSLTHRNRAFSLVISPHNGFIDNHIFLYGVYEPFILDLISMHLQEGMTFVDVGANIGQHSMYAASLVGEKGSVYSFEPIPAIYKQLQDSVVANHFEKIIHAKNIALGDKDSAEKLNVSKNIGGSSLVNDDDTKETITVHVKHSGNELKSIPSIDMIKIDVEGYEYEVLFGIHNLLIAYTPTLILEFSGGFYIKQNHGAGEKIIKLLRECHYSLFDTEDDMKKILDDAAFLNLFATKKRKQTNLLCIPQQTKSIS